MMSTLSMPWSAQRFFNLGQVGLVAGAVLEENIHVFDTFDADFPRVGGKVEAIDFAAEKRAMQGPLGQGEPEKWFWCDFTAGQQGSGGGHGGGAEEMTAVHGLSGEDVVTGNTWNHPSIPRYASARFSLSERWPGRGRHG
jgi:hypothetical protein